MPTIQATSLRSRVARRILGVFLLCAIIPFAGLVTVSYWQVTAFFNEKSQRQLRAMAKTFGMDVFERLILLGSSLPILASKVSAGGALPTDESLEALRMNPRSYWDGVALITAAGRRHRLLGRLDTLPEFTDVQRRHLASGKELLSILPATINQPPRIFMSALVDPRQTSPEIIIGEVNPSYLWGVEDRRVIPNYISLCVLDLSGNAMMCSYPAESLPEVLKQQINASAVGDYEWSQSGSEFLASYWTIPTKFEFQSPGWVVVLRTSKEGIFASIAELERTFLLWIVVCLGVSVLLAIYQIRKRLVPVEKLQEATQRIAQKDFDFRAHVASGDEFQELAVSMNDMAAQLGQQFNTLGTIAEIERAILAHLNTSKTVETILSRLMHIFPCDAAALTLFHRDRSDKEQRFLLINRSDEPNAPKGSEPSKNKADLRDVNTSAPHPAPAIQESELAKGSDCVADLVARTKVPLVVSDFSAASEPKVLEFLRENGFNSLVAAPLAVSDETLGVLSIYSKRQKLFPGQDITHLTRLSNQAAIAIHNSQLYEGTERHAVELEKANKLKDEFLSIISHELRTPINVIIGYLSVVREGIYGPINPNQAAALENSSQQSLELLAIVEMIMDASMIEAGEIAAHYYPISPASILDGLRARYTVPADKQITIHWKFDSDLPTLVTDEPKLRKILESLISNALKFTTQGTVTIAASHLPEEQVLEFKVRDTGVGIPEESIPLIFERFRQLDSSNTRSYGGLGLGLYTANKLAEIIGGELRVESKVGVGSTFTLRLPMRLPDATNNATVDNLSIITAPKLDYSQNAGQVLLRCWKNSG
jgi:signal transduction histidine kinase